MPALPSGHYAAIGMIEVCVVDASEAVTEDMEKVLARLYQPHETRPGDVGQAQRYWNAVGIKNSVVRKRFVDERKGFDLAKLEDGVRALCESGRMFVLSRNPKNPGWLCAVRREDGSKYMESASTPCLAVWKASRRA
jgi:hypothetical protein